MHRNRGIAFTAALALLAGGPALAQGGGKAVVVPKADLKWADAGVPGVSTAAVEGDMTKGPSHFFLRYAGGLVTPVHHHTADHYVTTLSGNLVLVADGKETKLAPGAYFALTGKAKHAARCEGTEACVMFIDARGAWDVVPETK
jgi:quercetin dioxygenase-like cupin family protein